MQSYLIVNEKTITRQEGDTGRIRFRQPVINTGNYNVTFKVVTKGGATIFTKTNANFTKSTEVEDGITYYVLVVYLSSADTTGWRGTHRWEMQLSSTTEIITLGRGCFTIPYREVIK
jgi:hypothetical protein